MGSFSFKKKRGQEEMWLSDSDSAILAEAVEKGTPCIPFIPVNALQQSLAVLKPEGLQGYFIVRVPTLYADGSIKYLYKEEFMLWTAVQGAISDMESTGRTYFFIGFEQLMTAYEDTPNEYLSPQIFYQSNLSLFRVDFQEELEFFHPAHSPLLELTFIPVDRNMRFKHVYVVNFLPVAHLHPPDEREDPSAIFEYYEEWRDLKYPLAGGSLQELLESHRASVRKLLSKE